MKKIFSIGAVVSGLFISFSINAQVQEVKSEEAGSEILVMKSHRDSFNDIRVHPNPSVDLFHVTSPEEYTVKVYDHLGEVVEQFITDNTKKTFGEDLLPGVYHLNFLQSGKVVKRMNVVKNW